MNKIPPPPVKSSVPPPPASKSAEGESEPNQASGGRANRSSNPNQIDLSTVLVTLGHLSGVFGPTVMSLKKRMQNVSPYSIDGSLILYRLVDVVELVETRTGTALNIANAHNQKASSGGGEASEAHEGIMTEISEVEEEQKLSKMTPAQMKTYFQAKLARETYLKAKQDNLAASGELVEVADVERSAIAAFKIISNFMENMGDILEREGVISSAEVEGVNLVVDKQRDQLADAMLDLAPNIESEL